MRLVLILLIISMLPGCGYYSRSPGQQVTAPDPTIYPAPSAGIPRYMPWATGWSYTPPMQVGGPLQISERARSTPERDPTGSPPTAP